MDLATLEQASEQYLGQWKRLVSTTNWDKGRIIRDWRVALEGAGLAAAEYSDETWSNQVGGVTPQHVGRLRRVFERFGDVRESYPGLFWSHFQAALDWNDAEMWLEGALQNDWSISEMRRTRAEALGTAAETETNAEEAGSADWDEGADYEPDAAAAGPTDALEGKVDVVRGTQKSHAAEDAGETRDEDEEARADGQGYDRSDEGAALADPVRPFANLATLPADVGEAFEAFKLCILKHKLAGWAEIARDDLVQALDALKELVVAPAGA